MPEQKSDQVELCIDGSQVKATDNVELLGVVIDNRLNFKSHLSKLIKKVGRQIDVLIDSNTFFRSGQRYVYIGHLLCHILLTVVLFGIAVSKKIVTV